MEELKHPNAEQRIDAYVKLQMALFKFKKVFKHDENLMVFMDGEMKDAIELAVFCPYPEELKKKEEIDKLFPEI